jgi:hypothetical protein
MNEKKVRFNLTRTRRRKEEIEIALRTINLLMNTCFYFPCFTTSDAKYWISLRGERGRFLKLTAFGV